MAITSFVWLKKSGNPVFGPANVRKLLVSRALVGYISLMSFIYWSVLFVYLFLIISNFYATYREIENDIYIH